MASEADVSDASVRMDLFMVPYLLLRLEDAAAQRIKAHVRAHPQGKLRFEIDGQDVGWQSNQNPVAVGELEMSPDLPSLTEEAARMHAVAAWSITVDHPLPCPVQLQ